MSTASLVLFGIGAVVAGSASSSHHRQPVRRQPAGPRRNPREGDLHHFVFAYSGLSIPVLGVGIASGYVGNFRAVLGCSVVLAVLALSAARISGGRRAARPRLRRTRADRSGLSYFEGRREIAIDDEHGRRQVAGRRGR